MRTQTRLEKSLPEAVYDRLFDASKHQHWLARRQEKLDALIESCINEEDQLFICDILDRFTYIDGDILADSLEEIGNLITKTWGCTPDNTLIVAMDKSRHADSSSAIAWLIKPVLADMGDWETTNFYKNLTDAINDIKDGQKIVIVDEFIGSGQTLARCLRWISNELGKLGKKSDIYVAAIAAMEICKRKDLSLATDFHSTIWLKQGLNDYYQDEQLDTAIQTMLKLESELHPEYNFMKLKKYSLGYKKSQSTYYLENGNPPNNNFPIFWWKMTRTGSRRRPLIARI